VQGVGTAKDVAQVDELKEREKRKEKEKEISFAELLLQFSSFHPFWSLSLSRTDYSSTGRAFN